MKLSATQTDEPFVNPLCISAVGEPDIDVCRNQVDWRLKSSSHTAGA